MSLYSSHNAQKENFPENLIRRFVHFCLPKFHLLSNQSFSFSFSNKFKNSQIIIKNTVMCNIVCLQAENGG